MKVVAIALIIFSMVACSSSIKAQSSSKRKVVVSYIIPYKNQSIKTKSFIYKPNDVEKLTIDSKADSTSSSGASVEIVTISLKIKPAVEVLNITELLNKFDIKAELSALPVKVDGTLIENRNEVYGVADAIANITQKNGFIQIATKIYLESKFSGKTDEIMIQ